MKCYNHFIESSTWWDVVVPGQWEAATVRHNDETLARLPYVLKRRGGVTLIGLPPLTPWNGPFFSNRASKNATRIRNEAEWSAALLQQLPAADAIMCEAPVEVKNLSGFLAHGYSLRASYTYRVDLGQTLDAIWDGMFPRTRQNIRKAEKLVDIAIDFDGDRLAAMVQKSFQRQHMDVGSWMAVIRRIVQTLQPAGHAHAYVAVGKDGRDHGAVLCVGDEDSMLYICGGADPKLRSSNAQSLLLWHAIRQAHGKSALFDFAGSMKPSIATHFQSFGGDQHVKLGIMLQNRKHELMNAVYKRARGGMGRLSALLRISH